MADTIAPSVEDRADKGTRLVLQPEEGRAYWQPKPANGYAIVKVSPDNCSSNVVTMGIQVVAPDGCYVREHWHSRNEEILFCFEGRGTIVVDGEPHVVRARHHGVSGPLGQAQDHQRRRSAAQVHLDVPAARGSTSSSPRSDGRALAGEPTPEPFERPAETLAVERRTGFGPPVGR